MYLGHLIFTPGHGAAPFCRLLPSSTPAPPPSPSSSTQAPPPAPVPVVIDYGGPVPELEESRFALPFFVQSFPILVSFCDLFLVVYYGNQFSFFDMYSGDS
jgi:hypothetical protein